MSPDLSAIVLRMSKEKKAKEEIFFLIAALYFCLKYKSLQNFKMVMNLFQDKRKVGRMVGHFITKCFS